MRGQGEKGVPEKKDAERSKIYTTVINLDGFPQSVVNSTKKIILIDDGGVIYATVGGIMKIPRNGA